MTVTNSPFYSLTITPRFLCVSRFTNSSFFVGVTDTYRCATTTPLEGFLSTFSLPYHNLSEWSCQPHFELLFLALSLPQQKYICVSTRPSWGPVTELWGPCRQVSGLQGPFALPCSLSGLRLSSLFFNVRYTPRRELLHGVGLPKPN